MQSFLIVRRRELRTTHSVLFDRKELLLGIREYSWFMVINICIDECRKFIGHKLDYYSDDGLSAIAFHFIFFFVVHVQYAFSTGETRACKSNKTFFFSSPSVLRLLYMDLCQAKPLITANIIIVVEDGFRTKSSPHPTSLCVFTRFSMLACSMQRTNRLCLCDVCVGPAWQGTYALIPYRTYRIVEYSYHVE